MEQLNLQEELLVWMRPAALPVFRKLYGRIESDLEANEKIKVEIQNNYNTYSFKGKKKEKAEKAREILKISSLSTNR